jgi:hypothetical protein
MAYIQVRQSVEDYEKWKAGFDAAAPVRQAAGATDEAYVMRNADNGNEIVVILGWSDLDQARQFAASPELKEAMRKAGVIGRPEVLFLNSVG